MSVIIATITSGKMKLESFEAITNQTFTDTRTMLLMEDTHAIHTDPLANKIENITRARNQVRSMALAVDCSHVWWVDSDVVPGRSALALLMAAGKEVCCGWFPGATGDGTWPHGWVRDGVYYYAKAPEHGLLAVDFSGFGCVLTSRAALESSDFDFTANQVRTEHGLRLESEATRWTLDANFLGFPVFMHGGVICRHLV